MLAVEYGYGFLAVFIISVLSLAGFVAFPLMRKPYYKYINAFFIALAVGTLYADLAFELFPVVRGTMCSCDVSLNMSCSPRSFNMISRPRMCMNTVNYHRRNRPKDRSKCPSSSGR